MFDAIKRTPTAFAGDSDRRADVENNKKCASDASHGVGYPDAMTVAYYDRPFVVSRHTNTTGKDRHGKSGWSDASRRRNSMLPEIEVRHSVPEVSSQSRGGAAAGNQPLITRLPNSVLRRSIKARSFSSRRPTSMNRQLRSYSENASFAGIRSPDRFHARSWSWE